MRHLFLTSLLCLFSFSLFAANLPAHDKNKSENKAKEAIEALNSADVRAAMGDKKANKLQQALATVETTPKAEQARKLTLKERIVKKALEKKMAKAQKKIEKRTKQGKDAKVADVGRIFFIVGLILVILGLVGMVTSLVAAGAGTVLLGLILILLSVLLF